MKKTPAPATSSPPVNAQSLLRLRQVLVIIPVSRSSWWAGVRSGRYPQPVKLGPATTCWRAADVLALAQGDSKGGAI